MIRLLRFLIWGDAHMHKWVPFGKVTEVYEFSDPSSGIPDARKQSFQCEICGKIRYFKV